MPELKSNSKVVSEDVIPKPRRGMRMGEMERHAFDGMGRIATVNRYIQLDEPQYTLDPAYLKMLIQALRL